MGKVHIGGRSDTVISRKVAAAEVVYVDREVETIVEKVVEVDRPVERMVERLVQVAPEVHEKIVHVQDPELLKQIEQMEYASIQKDIDHRRELARYEQYIETADDEMLVSSSSLIRSRSQHMIARKHREELVDMLRSERSSNRLKMKIAKYTVLAVIILNLTALFWR